MKRGLVSLQHHTPRKEAVFSVRTTKLTERPPVSVPPDFDRIGRSGADAGYTPSAFHWQPGSPLGSCRSLWRFVWLAKRDSEPQKRVASVVTRDSSRVRPRVPARFPAALGRGMNPTLRPQPRRFRRCVTTGITRPRQRTFNTARPCRGSRASPLFGDAPGPQVIAQPRLKSGRVFRTPRF